MSTDTSFLSEPTPLPDPLKRSRWQRFWAYPITRIVLFLLLFSVIVTALSLIPLGVFRLLHVNPRRFLTPLEFLGEGLSVAGTLLAAWIMVRFADKRPWSTAGFTLPEMPDGLLGGFAVGAVMLSIGVGVLWLLGSYHVTGLTPSVLLLLPLPLYLLVAAFEETLFRGYLFQTLETRWGSGWALGASSLFFGLAHLANPAPGETVLHHLAGPVFICFEAGLPLGAAYLLTRRLWLPIGIHWAWDYLEGPIYGCPDSGTHDPHSLLQAHFSGSSIVTGGTFGPEAGVVFLAVGTFAGLILLRTVIQRGQWRSGSSKKVSAAA